MEVQIFAFNPLQENTFVLYDETGECVIVDPGCFNDSEFEILDSFIKENKLRPVKIINTHCHFDHIFGVNRCRNTYDIPWEAHSDDDFLISSATSQAAMFGMTMSPTDSADKHLTETDELVFGTTRLQIIHVPGHSPGSICFYNETEAMLFAGDVLFRGSIGRTDLPRGDYNTLLSGIKQKILTLPENTIMYPGHGPDSTIAFEKARNPFLQ